MHERTNYAISAYSWYVPEYNQDPHWRKSGFMPCGSTLDEAYTRIREEIKRYGSFDPSKVKFKITKVVTVESTEAEFSDEDLTALILKHR